MILFIEPYVPPDVVEDEFEDGRPRRLRRDARPRASRCRRSGEMVKSDKRLVVFTEKDADGTVPWYLDGFSFVQDTPLGATKVEQLSL